MKLLRARLARFAIVGVAASLALVVASPTAALASSSRKYVYGTKGAYLGYGQWYSNPSGAYGNGWIQVYDAYCDGGNGIVANLYDWDRGGIWVGVAAVVGCGKYDSVDIQSYPAGPSESSRVELEVCKLLPSGAWKDCWHSQLLPNHN